MDSIQYRSQVGDDPVDLFFPNLPVEDLLEDGRPFVLWKLLVIQVVWVQNDRFLLAGCVKRLNEGLGGIGVHRGLAGHFLHRKFSGVAWR